MRAVKLGKSRKPVQALFTSMRRNVHVVSDLGLDGDPATQLLQEIFAFDITLAKIPCMECDSAFGLGPLALEGGSREARVRCSNCKRGYPGVANPGRAP